EGELADGAAEAGGCGGRERTDREINAGAGDGELGEIGTGEQAEVGRTRADVNELGGRVEGVVAGDLGVGAGAIDDGNAWIVVEQGFDLFGVGPRLEGEGGGVPLEVFVDVVEVTFGGVQG